MSIMENLTPYQMNVYYEFLLDGEDRMRSLALASLSPTEQRDDGDDRLIAYAKATKAPVGD